MYSALDDLISLIPEERLLQLTDDEQEGEFIISPPNAPYSKIVAAIEDADTIIDSFLVENYEVPFTTIIPKLVTQISTNLAIYTLYTRSHDLDAPEGIVMRYENYMKILEKIQSKEIKFPELVINDNFFKSSKTANDVNFGNLESY